jgi:hypothetical protein
MAKSERKNFCDPSQFAGVKSASFWGLSHVIAFYLRADFFLLSNKLQINGLSSKIFTAIYFGLNQKMFFINFFPSFPFSSAFSFDVLSHLAIFFSFVFPLPRVASEENRLSSAPEEGSNNKVWGWK